MLISLIVFILLLGVLVFVHELGHFMVAKWTGMRVDEFNIGFPPHVVKKKIGETLYYINLIPLGGYVKIHGENPEHLEELIEETEAELAPDQKAVIRVDLPRGRGLSGKKRSQAKKVEIQAPHEKGSQAFKVVKTNLSATDDVLAFDQDPRAFNNRPIWSRILVLLGGVSMNMLLAFLVLSMAFSVGFVSVGQDLEKIPGAKVKESRVLISGFTDQSAAQAGGIQAGDYVVSVSNPATGKMVSIDSISTLQTYTRAEQKAGTPRLELTLDREGQKVTKEVVLDVASPEPLGVQIAPINRVQLPVWQAPLAAGREIGIILDVTWGAIKGFALSLFTHGKLDSSLSGPVGVYQATSAATQQGPVSVIFLLVVLSVNLALLNLMPIPALDGGKLIFLFSELIFRRRVIAERVEATLTAAGFFFLIALMVIITVRDVTRLL